jgi:ankyrin repeat protein
MNIEFDSSVKNSCEHAYIHSCCVSDSKEPKAFPVNFNLMDSSGNTPLSLALTAGMQHIVAILIQGEWLCQILNDTGSSFLQTFNPERVT